MEIRRRNRWLCLSFGHKRVYAQIGLCSFLFSKKVRNTAPRGPCRWQTPPAMHVSDYKGPSERVISLSLGLKVTLLVTHYTLRPRATVRARLCAHPGRDSAPRGPTAAIGGGHPRHPSAQLTCGVDAAGVPTG